MEGKPLLGALTTQNTIGKDAALSRFPFGPEPGRVMIGLLTPPIGMLLYIVSGIGDVAISAILHEIWVFLIALFLVLLLVAFVPAITLWLPAAFMSGPTSP